MPPTFTLDVGLNKLPSGCSQTLQYRFACFALCVGAYFVEMPGGVMYVLYVQRYVKNYMQP